MSRELPAAWRLPLFALAVAIAAAVGLLSALDPSPRAHHRPRPAAAAPPAMVYAPPSVPSASPPPAATPAFDAGRRFLRLYVRLQSQRLDSAAAARLRSLSTLALARTLLAQPPLPAGGSRSPASLARLRPERLSSSAVVLHAAIRNAGALVRVRCLVQRDRDRWTVTGLTAAP